jgi:hypothetical protein
MPWYLVKLALQLRTFQIWSVDQNEIFLTGIRASIPYGETF